MELFPEELAYAFEVKEVLNSGTYGNIYRVIKRSNQKIYAMKTVVLASTESSWKGIVTEMQILSWANPYKLHLDCFFVSGNTFYMIIDYYQKGDLLAAIDSKIEDNELFEEDEIWKYFIQICFGLESLHCNGLIHWGLLPQNILLDENKDIKISDFGISCSFLSSTTQGIPIFQSPRTNSADIQATESDVWSVGCILYYLCNLEHPFGNDEKIKYEHYKPISSNYSNELRYFVDMCLKKQRIERPTIIDILTHEFIIKKTLSLDIAIPQTSVMNANICQILLKKKRERNKQLETELSKYRKENVIQKKEIESLKAEIARLNRIKNGRSKSLKGLENVKESINQKTKSEKSLLNYQISQITNCFNRKLKETESALSIIDTLKNKTAEILSMPNNPELEMDFRATCSAYQSNYILNNSLLMQAYQDYLNAYHQKISLYNFKVDKDITYLYTHNTETETKDIKVLQTPEQLNWGTCMTQLPNGNLFCYGKSNPSSGITVIIDVNGRVEVLPSGSPCWSSSCTYFNDSVYCFGGYNMGFSSLFRRFDLNQNRWIQLAPMPINDWIRNCIVFNRNILISGVTNKHLLLYSTDIDSFSTIPYEFAANKTKILINADRLYLIECNKGSIYESEIGSGMDWKWIAGSIIIYSPIQVYCSYNKGCICILGLESSNIHHYKFNLKEKVLTELI